MQNHLKYRIIIFNTRYYKTHPNYMYSVRLQINLQLAIMTNIASKAAKSPILRDSFIQKDMLCF